MQLPETTRSDKMVLDLKGKKIVPCGVLVVAENDSYLCHVT